MRDAVGSDLRADKYRGRQTIVRGIDNSTPLLRRIETFLSVSVTQISAGLVADKKVSTPDKKVSCARSKSCEGLIIAYRLDRGAICAMINQIKRLEDVSMSAISDALACRKAANRQLGRQVSANVLGAIDLLDIDLAYLTEPVVIGMLCSIRQKLSDPKLRGELEAAGKSILAQCLTADQQPTENQTTTASTQSRSRDPIVDDTTNASAHMCTPNKDALAKSAAGATITDPAATSQPSVSTRAVPWPLPQMADEKRSAPENGQNPTQSPIASRIAAATVPPEASAAASGRVSMTADPTRQPPPSKIAPSESSNGNEKVDEAAAGRGSLTAPSSAAPTAPPTPKSETLGRPTPSLENNRVEVIAKQSAALGSAAASTSTS